MNEEESVKKVGLLDLAILILERKWLFVGCIGAFSLAGLVAGNLLTKRYTARAVIMKPSPKLQPGLSSLMGKNFSSSGPLRSAGAPGENAAIRLLSILSSSRLADRVIDRFDLIHVYRFDKRNKYYREDVRNAYFRNVEMTENDCGNIEVSVSNESPLLAAHMADFVLYELDTITRELSRESARNARVFFEDRLRTVKSDLDSATWELSRFQTENNYIQLDEQVKSSIDALGGFEGHAMAIDLEIAQVKNAFGTDNPLVAELEDRKAVIGRKIDEYMYKGGGNLIVSLRNEPEKAVRYGRLLRNVRIQESLYEFVLRFCEQAKLSEANNAPLVQVLEYAQTPQKTARPQRSVIWLMFLFAGFILTSAAILCVKWCTIQRQHRTLVYVKAMRMGSLLPFGADNRKTGRAEEPLS